MDSHFIPNPDFERELQLAIAPAAQQSLMNLRRNLDQCQADHAGHEVNTVKAAFQEAWNSSNPDASIDDPELETCAQAISAGQRVWISDDGKIMVSN
jgi:hypothetical protein